MPVPEPGPSSASTPSSSSWSGASESRTTMNRDGSRAYSLEDLGLLLRGLDLRTPQSSVDAALVDYMQHIEALTCDEDNAFQPGITDADDSWLVQVDDPQHDMLTIRVDLVTAHMRNVLLAIVNRQQSQHKQALYESTKRLKGQTRIRFFVENKLRETMNSKSDLEVDLKEAIKEKETLQETLNAGEQKNVDLQAQLAQAIATNAKNQETLDELLERLHTSQRQVTELQAEREELLRVLELCNAKNEINERDRRWRGQMALH
ncbi:hypothetical protein ASPACDRAFT_44259 [Aspergillus aculeatus ATCC 16872]|uniref:Uncharacterized protein n=1 Tax=Aspergillus aculeatus (strain ATCC 16872 / CBS 172.66 / WB 5094) TaxID=690307 RepID=A0A1L9WRC0_ASPA1|nr:uncharacterized protein ASPACDRAFT_44259 [Aspergillus aculeatus ATCC 16872]OJJ98628.1 hypothetical protein ASPACDRAFT_44259 [Aspergillus aculeatus ATCC 16872]